MNNKWKIKKLGEVLTIERGGSPRPIKKYLTNSNDGINWIKISDATASEKYIYETKEKITRDGLHKTRVVNDGDFILSNSMSFGRPYIMKTTGCIHDGWLVLKQNGKKIFETEFLYYLLSSPYVFQQFNYLAAGSTVRNLNIALVSSVKVPVPSLPEQKRIVKILDETFSAIDTAKINAEQNLKNVAALFESYLQSAIEGKLSREPLTNKDAENYLEEQNNEPAQTINQEEIPFALPQSWRWCRLGSIAKFNNGDRGKNYPNKKEYVSSGVPWINTGHIKPDGSLSIELMNYITAEKFDSLRSGKIEKNDLVYCLRGATIGKTAFVEPFTKGAVASSLVIIRPESKINRKYLYYFLTSPFGKKLIKRFDNGAAQPNLGANSVKKYVTPLPPLSEQIFIVKKLDALSAETKNLEGIYKQKINDLEELKKSVLQKAFNGELL